MPEEHITRIHESHRQLYLLIVAFMELAGRRSQPWIPHDFEVFWQLKKKNSQNGNNLYVNVVVSRDVIIKIFTVISRPSFIPKIKSITTTVSKSYQTFKTIFNNGTVTGMSATNKTF